MAKNNKSKMNLPNKLSLFRILMVPVFLVCFAVPFEKLWGVSENVMRIIIAVIFAITSLTDMIDGKIARNALLRLLRDNVVIAEDKISSLKRFKDDAKEVAEGYDCGIGLEKFNDIREGDVYEAFIMEEIKD